MRISTHSKHKKVWRYFSTTPYSFMACVGPIYISILQAYNDSFAYDTRLFFSQISGNTNLKPLTAHRIYSLIHVILFRLS